MKQNGQCHVKNRITQNTFSLKWAAAVPPLRPRGARALAGRGGVSELEPRKGEEERSSWRSGTE